MVNGLQPNKEHVHVVSRFFGKFKRNRRFVVQRCTKIPLYLEAPSLKASLAL